MSRSQAPLWIKICGLRNAADIAAAATAGANAVGFVFHADSPRNLSPADARALATYVPSGIERVAVFLHPTQAELDAAIDALQPDWVQTDADDLQSLALPAGQKVLPVYRTDHALPLQLPRRSLLESGRSGAGERADWITAANLARRSELVLAGGLDVTNVGAAIAAVQPFGIDVSSGVEATRGVKDAALINQFVNAARAMHARLAASSLE